MNMGVKRGISGIKNLSDSRARVVYALEDLGHLLPNISQYCPHLSSNIVPSFPQLVDKQLQALHDKESQKAHMRSHPVTVPCAQRARPSIDTWTPKTDYGYAPRLGLEKAPLLVSEAFAPEPNHCPQPARSTLDSRADNMLQQDPSGMMMPESIDGYTK